MGGGDKPKDGSSGASDSSTLQVEVICEYEQIPADKKQECCLMVRVKAAPPMNEDRRAPITICAAIDRSASMKDNLPLLKETLQFMVQQLRPEDRLCLITFDHLVSIVLPLTYMTVSGKANAERAIEGIRERGHTNLSGGLLAALQALNDITEGDNSLVESVLLFSDGKANYGIKDQEGLTKATKSMLSTIARQACVFTMGYGVEHDADILHAIADAGNGLFYYIENRDNIPDCFCDCLGGLLSVAAQNIRLSVIAADGVHLSSPYTKYTTDIKKPGDHYQIAIPDVYCEEEKCIPLKSTIPSKLCEKDEEMFHVLRCDVEYFDVLNSQPAKISTTFHIKRSRSCTEAVPNVTNNDITLHNLRCEVAETLEKASVTADQGNYAFARQMLQQCRQKVNKKVAFATPLSKYLVDTIDESLGGLESSVVYREHGKSTLMNYTHSHWQQRSNCAPSMDSYCAAKKSVPPVCQASPLSDSASSYDNPYKNSSKAKLQQKFKAKKKK